MDFWGFFRFYVMSKVLLGIGGTVLILLAFYAVPMLLMAIAEVGSRIMRTVWGDESSRRRDE